MLLRWVQYQHDTDTVWRHLLTQVQQSVLSSTVPSASPEAATTTTLPRCFFQRHMEVASMLHTVGQKWLTTYEGATTAISWWCTRP